MRKTRLLIAAIFLMSPFAANADLIEITGGGDADGIWDITLVEGVYTDYLAELIANPWFGDQALTQLFAATLGDALGFVNGPTRGPAFLGTIDGGWFSSAGSGLREGYRWADFGTTIGFSGFDNQVWAIAERVSVPEPGTLALLGIGLAALGLSRRRRAA